MRDSSSYLSKRTYMGNSSSYLSKRTYMGDSSYYLDNLLLYDNVTLTNNMSRKDFN